MKETYSITPAENPKAADKNFSLVCFVKKAKALPMPVDNPASKVNAKANNTLFISKAITLSAITSTSYKA
jgi:hypothetical protein